MKAFMLMTASGPIVILSSHASPEDEVFLGKIRAKGIDKFMAYEVPWERVERFYGGHFQTVLRDLHETDDLRVLDFNGQRVFSMLRLKDLPEPLIHEPDGVTTKVYMD